MRPGAGFNAAAAGPVVVAGAGAGAHSAWHSPVPYLFGGLAAMLGLIALALLILACSYWKLSGYLAAGDGAAVPAAASGEKIPATATAVKYEEKVVVIMAGDAKPTFLATPVSSRASSFGDNGGDSKLKEKIEKETVETETEKKEEEEEDKHKHTQQDTQNFTQNHEEV